MLHWLLAESAGRFWWPEEFENVANTYFKNLKHLQNPGHLPLTKESVVPDIRFLASSLECLRIESVVKILVQSFLLSKYQFKGRMYWCTRHPTLVEGLVVPREQDWQQ